MEENEHEDGLAEELALLRVERTERPELPRLDISALSSRAGGHFKLCTLVTKRAKELMAGSRRRTQLRAKSPINIALKEYEEEQIELLSPEEARRRLLGGDGGDEVDVLAAEE